MHLHPESHSRSLLQDTATRLRTDIADGNTKARELEAQIEECEAKIQARPCTTPTSVTGCEPVVLCILEHDYYCRMPLQRPRSAGQWRRMPSCIMAIPEVRITDDSYFLHRTHMCTTRSWIDSCKADPT